jgi:hypothetical protein
MFKSLMPKGACRVPTQVMYRVPKDVLNFKWDNQNWKESLKILFSFTDFEIDNIQLT